MKSMTGFGKAVVAADGRKVTIELKAVNHRYLDLNIKLPRILNFAEDVVRKTLQNNFARGHIDVYVAYENKREDSVKLILNEPLASQYIAINGELAAKYGVSNDFSTVSLMRFSDVVTEEESDEDENAIAELVKSAAEEASAALTKMRLFEGEKLRKDFLVKIDNIERLVAEIKKYAPTVVENYRVKLAEKIREALDGVQPDEARLLNEVAFFTDKAAIDEEIMRLESHCHHARELIGSSEPVGRSLDFLIQEFNREANTIGSKSNDITITNCVLTLKNEIEKIREQVQNAE